MHSTEDTSGKAETRGDLRHALALGLQAVVSAQSCTKRTAVRLAISNCIQSGVLRPGDYLPSEKALADIFGVSLGTVQVALGQLQDVGLLQRRRGDGTRVSDTEPLAENTWHFRFLSRESKRPLRMTDSRPELSKVEDAGYWSEFLGAEPFYFRIARLVRMNDGTRAAAQMYIPGSLAEGLDQINVSELALINIRPFLEEHLNLKISERTNRVSVVIPDRGEVRSLGLAAGQPHYEISATAFTNKKQPAYHQRILVAVADCDLEF